MIYFIEALFEWPMRNGLIMKQRYQIHSFIGRGSYGLVYKATDLSNGRVVVIKQLRRRKRKIGKDFFTREATMLSSFHHAAIPKFIDLFDEGKNSFLVMEYIEGKNVEELIFQEGLKYDENKSFRILFQVLKIVDIIHKNGIIHRDLRLPNILFHEDHVYIIDFGLAVFCDEKDPVDLESMPLEKRLFREISTSSDYYALGHFLLFLLYSNFQTLSRKKRSWEEELDISEDAKRIIRKLLKIIPGYQSVSEIMSDIQKLYDVH
jgi:serine/threonine protein kinase, bacterial